MKKILTILFALTACIMVNAQTYSQELVNKAESGDAQAMNDLGYCYEHGKGITHDYSQAVYWYKKAAKNGNAHAMYNIFLCYYYEKGLKFNATEAMYWFEKAKKHGYEGTMQPPAQDNKHDDDATQNQSREDILLAAFEMAQAGDKKKAKELLRQDFTKKESGIDTELTYDDNIKIPQLSVSMQARPDKTEAAPLTIQTVRGHIEFVKVSENNTSDKQKNDTVEARKETDFQELARKAENGDAEAMNNLGFCYYYGKGVTMDKSQADYWFKKAVQTGREEANNMLLLSDEEGRDTMQDQSKDDILTAAAGQAETGDNKGTKELERQDFTNPEPDNDTEYTSHKNAIQPAIMEIVPGSVIFADATGNNAIDADETCTIRFKVRNKGTGYGRGCVAVVKTSAADISVRSKDISEIAPGTALDIEIPVKAGKNMTEGQARFAISVYEPNGFGCDPVNLIVDTHALAEPLLKIVDYTISNEDGSKPKKIEPFDLTLKLQNIKDGTAENVNVTIELPQNVFIMKGKESHSYATMDAGEKKTISYTLIANNYYSSPTIPVKVKVTEKYGRYAESRTISVAMNQQTTQTKNVVVKSTDNARQQGK